ncbi:transmembrane protein 91-like [Lacerta agilis]|uniref:transmembrane protein 91-like n=1 Tax=Lacerta agilis TaxID=80427 RepID=UPI0014193F04|nr:transmembrane protein 91-like [Lacerta agilis]
MSNYERLKDDSPNTQDPPPYSDKASHEDPEPTKSLSGSEPHGMGWPSNPVPSQYQHYVAAVAGSHQVPIFQPPQATIIIRGPPANEPDYLAYSICTMLCCCLPLGIAALVYSIKTQEGNLNGDVIVAKRNSRMARILNHTALGVGCFCVVMYIIIMATLYWQLKNQHPLD